MFLLFFICIQFRSLKHLLSLSKHCRTMSDLMIHSESWRDLIGMGVCHTARLQDERTLLPNGPSRNDSVCRPQITPGDLGLGPWVSCSIPAIHPSNHPTDPTHSRCTFLIIKYIKFLNILAAEAPQKRGLKFDWLGAEFNRSHYSHAPHILKVKPAPSQHRHDAKICHGMSWHKRWNQTTLRDERMRG